MSIQSLFAKVNTEVVADAEEAWTALINVWDKDAEPIIKATVMYVESNGATDLLLIAKRVVVAEIEALLSGGNPIEALSALAGTVYDEAKSAGLQISQGAALLVTSMVHAEASASAGNASSAPAVSGTAPDSSSTNS